MPGNCRAQLFTLTSMKHLLVAVVALMCINGLDCLVATDLALWSTRRGNLSETLSIPLVRLNSSCEGSSCYIADGFSYGVHEPVTVMENSEKVDGIHTHGSLMLSQLFVCVTSLGVALTLKSACWRKHACCHSLRSDTCSAIDEQPRMSACGPAPAPDCSSDSETDSTDLIPDSEPSSGESSCDSELPHRARPVTQQTQSLPGHGRIYGSRGSRSKRRCRNAARFNCQYDRQQTMMNRQDSCSVAPVRPSVRAVIDALDEWLVSNAAEKLVSSQSNSKSTEFDLQSQTASVLHEALLKLNPHDTALLQACLDSRSES
jgi:hypothetical protein